ncbi:MAG: hypothetical protein K0R51_2525 [Cytophagaceae bacterium]|jgi:PPE-repeat protein|nr:hypothetical protein [Cytophagaceae bacterium]
MEKLLKSTLLVILMSVSGLAMADEGETCKCANSKSVALQLNRKMEQASAAHGIPNGTVMLRYTIDENNQVHIAEIQSNNDLLKSIVSTNLEGQTIKMKGERCTEGYVRMNFVDTGNETKAYVIY